METDLVHDGSELAAQAELRYVSDGEEGIRRRRRGSGFSYQYDNGRPVGREQRERIEKLSIPPAWTSVWICHDSDGHMQATGRDDADRKQYIYHQDWERVRDEAKFDRLVPFGNALPSLRRELGNDLRRRSMQRTKVVALAIAILDRTVIRVGNHRYTEENDSYGLTTIAVEHAEVNGSLVRLNYASKAGVDREVAFRDRRLADLVIKCQELDGQTLFSYLDANGEVSSIASQDVNLYLREAMDGEFTAKDFRTWGASTMVTECLGEKRNDDDPVLDAIDEAAEALGNTRAVCRTSYVHPALENAYESDQLAQIWKRTRRTSLMARAERVLIRVLETCN